MLTASSPAKLNLMLRIVDRRADGFHELQSIFQFLDFADAMRFELSANHTVQRIDKEVRYDNDLILRAAALLKAHTGCDLGANIHLEKHIPTGGGLGGGSSNAASTLVALNQLWQLDLSINTLADLGLQLGADVPVFVRGFAAWAEGVGEVLTPIEPPEKHYLIVHPKVHVNTGEIFASKELTRDSTRIKIPTLLSAVGRNDCLKVVCDLYPDIAKAMDWLGQFSNARLTGTGACIFADFDGAIDAKKVLEKLPPHWNGFIAKGQNRSSLHTSLGVTIGV